MNLGAQVCLREKVGCEAKNHPKFFQVENLELDF